MKKILSYGVFEAFASKEMNSIFRYLGDKEISKLKDNIQRILNDVKLDLPISELSTEHIKYLPSNKAFEYGMDSTNNLVKIWYNKEGKFSFLSTMFAISNDKVTQKEYVYGEQVEFVIDGETFIYVVHREYLYSVNKCIFNALGLSKYKTAYTYYGYPPTADMYYGWPPYRSGDFKAVSRMINALQMICVGRKPYEALGLIPNASYDIDDYTEIDNMNPYTHTGDMLKVQFYDGDIVIAQVFKNPLNNELFLIQNKLGMYARDILYQIGNVPFLHDFYIDNTNLRIYMVEDMTEDYLIKKVSMVYKKNIIEKKDSVVYSKLRKNVSYDSNRIDIEDMLTKHETHWAIIMDLDAIRKDMGGMKTKEMIRDERIKSKQNALVFKTKDELTKEFIERYLVSISDKIDTKPIIGIFNSIPMLTFRDEVLYNFIVPTHADNKYLDMFEEIFKRLVSVLKPDTRMMNNNNNDNILELKKIFIEHSRNCIKDYEIVKHNKRQIRSTLSKVPYLTEHLIDTYLLLLEWVDEISKLLANKLKHNNKSITNIERSIEILHSIESILDRPRYSLLRNFILSTRTPKHVENYIYYLGNNIEYIDVFKEQIESFRKLVESLF